MYRTANKFLTKQQAVKMFKEIYDLEIADAKKRKDKPALYMMWNNYTDNLQRNGQISDHQFKTWVGPFK